VAWFVVERTREGSRIVRLYDAAGFVYLRSSPMTSDEAAVSAIERLKKLVGNDWRYQINQERGGGPFFSLSMRRPHVVFTSPEFSSCDVMEGAIELLKAIAPSADVAFANESDSATPNRSD
jgi:hypothetical protein